MLCFPLTENQAACHDVANVGSLFFAVRARCTRLVNNARESTLFGPIAGRVGRRRRSIETPGSFGPPESFPLGLLEKTSPDSPPAAVARFIFFRWFEWLPFSRELHDESLASRAVVARTSVAASEFFGR